MKSSCSGLEVRRWAIPGRGEGETGVCVQKRAENQIMVQSPFPLDMLDQRLGQYQFKVGRTGTLNTFLLSSLISGNPNTANSQSMHRAGDSGTRPKNKYERRYPTKGLSRIQVRKRIRLLMKCTSFKRITNSGVSRRVSFATL